MNIYITATPDIPTSLIEDVCKELNQVKGVMNFIPTNSLTQIELKRIDTSLENINNEGLFPFTKFFNICHGYRLIKNLNDSDFAVVLTSIRNSQNWFSASESRNIFIDTNDWNQFTGKDPKYGICYQIIENVFQSLIGITHNNAEGHPNVHLENIGCINDMCGKKSTVILKLRTADICPSCQEKASELGVDWNIMNQIQEIMESIRKNVRSLNTYSEVKLEKVIIDKTGKITVGTKEIGMNELPSTLFIFFLNQQRAISKTSLQGLKREILRIYERVKGKGDEETIERLIDPNGKAFRHNKWCVNDALENILNESLLGYYIIDEVADKKYIIHISPEFREIDPTLIL